LFLGGGRVSRFVPSGGLENFDWERHRQAHGPDSGRWELVAGGEIRIAWGDGGVHQGKLTVHSDGIEFYGKRYARPANVSLADLAGTWEAARGTAVAGGQGVNRVSTLLIHPDGRYELGAVTGGVVAGRATSTAGANSGRVSISGATMVLRSDGGGATSYTFLPAAGSPVTAFTLDADMFTRVR
jgi:hypothetical protein